MSKVTIKLAPIDIRPGLMSGRYKLEVAQFLLPKYEVQPSFETELTGQKAAEEAFDLTNNPSRQSERELSYGRLRSVSVGDIVEVDGVNYFCDSFGWVEI